MGAHRPLDRAILAGLVIAEQPSGPCGPYRLFRSEVDRQLWHAWQELRACTDPARGAELATEIHELRRSRQRTTPLPRRSGTVTDQWGYVDPAERVHEEQVMWNMAQPMAAGFGPPQWTPPVQSPLDLSNVPAIMFGNGNTTPRYRSPLEAAVIGAVLGGLFDVWRAKRRARKAQSEQARVQELKDKLGIGDVE